jgi:peroxiredoxin/outer membrane lipoprotein-sorting protein
MRCWISLLLFAPAASAQTEPQAMMEAMRKAYAGLHAVSLVAEQSQEISAGALSGSVDSEYELAVKAGGKFRVHFKQGDQDSISVSNGTKTWKASPRARQWTQIDAAGSAEEGDEEAAPDSQAGSKDLPGIVQDLLVTRYIAFAKLGREPEILKEENYKLGKEKVPCVVLRVRVGDVAHDLWIDRRRGFVLQEIQTSKRKMNGMDATVKATIKLKRIETDSDVDDSAFQFEPDRNWHEVEMLVLPGERSVSLNGLMAGDFRIKTLEGDQIQLSSFRGKVVVLDFWATWCPPCREELPYIEKLRSEFTDKVQFFGIDDEDSSTVKDFQRKHNYGLTVLVDQKRTVHRQYGVEAIPTVSHRRSGWCCSEPLHRRP